jgi:hypothetical protein
MSAVKLISSPKEIHAGRDYVLVMYGEEYAQTKHSHSHTITVARNPSKNISELSFLTAISFSQGAR